VSGQTYVFPANDDKVESARVEFAGDQATITMTIAGHAGRVSCGSAAWRRGGTLPNTEGVDQPVAASGAWTSDDTYTARVYLTETPFRLIATFRFDGDRLVLDREMNVATGDAATKRPQLVGQAAPDRP
jgi:hypothetical protein